jgi:hypothetical protein
MGLILQRYTVLFIVVLMKMIMCRNEMHCVMGQEFGSINSFPPHTVSANF